MFTADLLERAVKTFVQTFIATFGLVFIAPSDVTNAGAWKAAGIAAVMAAVTASISAVTSLVSKGIGDKDTASIVPTEANVAPHGPVQ